MVYEKKNTFWKYSLHRLSFCSEPENLLAPISNLPVDTLKDVKYLCDASLDILPK